MSNFLAESYENGYNDAFRTIEKIAGADVAGALYEHMTKEAGPKWDATKKFFTTKDGFKEGMGKAKDSVKDYHKGAWKDIKGKGRVQQSGAQKGQYVDATTKGEKARSILRGAAKLSPHAAATGAAGYGGYRAATD